jgi:Fe-S cluster biogenesis protein NfuA
MNELAIERANAEKVVERIRPAIQADGGDIEVVGVEGADVYVRLTGRCVGCPSAERTLRDGLELRLKRDVPGFGRVIEVH